MNIETTTCISIKHYKILQLHANHHNIPIRSLVSALLSFAADHEKVNIKYFKQLRYRPRGNGDWRRLHLVLYDDEYEFFMDMKKLWKMSLAFIIAYCLDNVLYEFLEFLTGAEQDDDYYTDNYRYKGYAFEICVVDGVFCCKLYWGPHPEILHKAS